MDCDGELSTKIDALSIKTTPQHNPKCNLYNFATLVGENQTEFVFRFYENYSSIVITQLDKIGNIYQVKTDRPQDDLEAEPVFHLRNVMGTDDIEAEAAIRYVAGNINIRYPLMICLSLMDFSKNTVNTIIEHINKHEKPY